MHCAELIYSLKDLNLDDLIKDNKVIDLISSAVDLFYAKFNIHYKDEWQDKINKGFESLLGKKINEYYKEKFKNENFKIALYFGWAYQRKHFYKIPDFLNLSNKDLIHIYNTNKYFTHTTSYKEIAIYYKFLEYIDFIPNIVTAGLDVTNKKVTCFATEHVYSSITRFGVINENGDPFGLKLQAECKKFNLNYVFSTCLQNYNIESKLNDGFEVIKGGYPGIDYNISHFKQISSKYVVIALDSEEYLTYQTIEELIKLLLDNEFKVIYRPHPECINIKLPNIKHKNYILDENLSILDTMSKSFTYITNFSSTAHTYPLTTLRKSILYMPKDYFDRKILGQSFFDENLHEKASNFDELLAVVKKLHALKDDKASQEKIAKYRAEQVFNLGHSSEFIADFILKHMKK